MMSDYEKGVAILRLIRSGDDAWVAKVLQVRDGTPAVPQFEEISLKPGPPPPSAEEASRALEWASVIWLSELCKVDESLIELVDERNQRLAEAAKLREDAEANFRERVAKLSGALSSQALADEVLRDHAMRVSESEQRKNAFASTWLEINRERLLSQSAQLRRAQGIRGSRSMEESEAEEQRKRRDMELIRSWIEQEEEKLRRYR